MSLMGTGSELEMAHAPRASMQQEALRAQRSLDRQPGQQRSSHNGSIARVKNCNPWAGFPANTPGWHTPLQAVRTCSVRACVPPNVGLYFVFGFFFFFFTRSGCEWPSRDRRYSGAAPTSPRLLLPAQPQPHPSAPGAGKQRLSPGLPKQMKKGDFQPEDPAVPGRPRRTPTASPRGGANRRGGPPPTQPPHPSSSQPLAKGHRG